MKRIWASKKLTLPFFDIFIIVLCITFASWLMFHTFSYDAKTHDIRIAYKLWSDFGAHIPLIRSFSMGDNLDRFFNLNVQYPIFPGEPIRYHFLFYMIVGIFERLGMRIDWALNLPSIAGFVLLLLSIYYLTWRFTHSKFTAVLALVFFLFNGSFGFIRFFTLHPITIDTVTDIVHAKDFPAFAPWGPGEITAFWNLNIYTNQRHLAAAFAIVLLFIITTLRLIDIHWKKQIPWAIFWGITLGMFPFFHQPALLICAVFMSIYFFCFPTLRIFLFFTGVLALELIIPQLLAVRGSGSPLEWYPGYTIHNELQKQATIIQKTLHMISYWWQNIGLHLILIPVGFFLIPKRSRLFVLPMIPLFILPNLVKFSIEASANHKFFNFFLIFGNMLSAHVIVSIMSAILKKRSVIMQSVGVFASGCMIIVLTLTGIIDFFVIYNDAKGTLSDVHPTATWIATHTSPGDVFLNSNYLYHPASLAGRPVFLGWPYFAWSAGYKENRMPIMDIMYETRDEKQRCDLMKKYSISYVTVEDVRNDTNLPDIELAYFLRNYTPSYTSANKQYAIFSFKSLCEGRTHQ